MAKKKQKDYVQKSETFRVWMLRMGCGEEVEGGLSSTRSIVTVPCGG